MLTRSMRALSLAVAEVVPAERAEAGRVAGKLVESDGFARDQRDGLNWDHLVAG
jgi:hypothetical protein